MRISLATAVIVAHEGFVNYADPSIREFLWHGWPRPFLVLILPMFFTLSGFLVAGSLERTRTIFGFLALRVYRIFPALIVEIVLSALILGPIVTVLPLREYFGSSGFWQYFWNCIGWIHYTLPGVFINNPEPNIVNGQLWTVPYELECYIALSVIFILPFIGFKRALLIAVAVIQLMFAARSFAAPLTTENSVSGRVLVLVFLVGVALYAYRDRIPWSALLAVVATVVSVALIYVPGGVYFIAIPSAYLTVYLGLLNPRRSKLIDSGDYSYGMYLYGYPIQQTVAWLGPWTHHWAINLAISFPIIVLFSIASWHGLEKHVMKRRGFIKVVETKLFGPVDGAAEWQKCALPLIPVKLASGGYSQPVGQLWRKRSASGWIYKQDAEGEAEFEARQW